MKYVLFAFLGYILFQFIFKLVIPVYQASQKIKKGFGEMNEKMKQQQAQTSQPNQPQKEPTVKAGEYIEFEELK